MADNDEFWSQLPPSMRKPYQAARGDASPAEFVALCVPALAQLFRQDGCPGFEKMLEIIRPCCAIDGQAPLFPPIDQRAAEALRREMLDAYAGTEAHTIVDYASRACVGIVLQAQVQECVEGDAGELLAQEVCLALITGVLAGRLAQSQVFDRFLAECGDDLEAASRALSDYCGQVEALLPDAIRPIASQLADDPSCQTMKSRARRIPKRSTAELMMTPLT